MMQLWTANASKSGASESGETGPQRCSNRFKAAGRRWGHYFQQQRCTFHSRANPFCLPPRITHSKQQQQQLMHTHTHTHSLFPRRPLSVPFFLLVSVVSWAYEVQIFRKRVLVNECIGERYILVYKHGRRRRTRNTSRCVQRNDNSPPPPFFRPIVGQGRCPAPPLNSHCTVS